MNWVSNIQLSIVFRKEFTMFIDLHFVVSWLLKNANAPSWQQVTKLEITLGQVITLQMKLFV